MPLHIIILAAGQGVRMQSSLPKVLHPLAGKPLLDWVITTAESLLPQGIHVIYGHGGEQLQAAMKHKSVQWIAQEKQLGTGHAVLQALPLLPADAEVLILSGDVPLIETDTLTALIAAAQQSGQLSLLTAKVPDPTGLGRILRDEKNRITAIVEEKDASPSERSINEIYTGVCCVSGKDLAHWLPLLTPHNAQKEYYLTDIIAMAVASHQHIASITPQHLFEIQGVNNRLQLQQLERVWQEKQAEKLLLSGVTLTDARRIDIRGELLCGKDVFIDSNCVFTGKVILGDNCHIGPNCMLSDAVLQQGCKVLANSVLEGCEAGEDCHIGPFARVRAGTRLARGCKIGNFVETKNAVFGESSKANHLSYLGDVTLGRKVNVGAGMITCNYDGAQKHHTSIEDGAFIGSGTQLVAPVTVGAHATVGAGSTLRKDAPAGELTLTVTPQKTIPGWVRPEKK